MTGVNFILYSYGSFVLPLGRRFRKRFDNIPDNHSTGIIINYIGESLCDESMKVSIV